MAAQLALRGKRQYTPFLLLPLSPLTYLYYFFNGTMSATASMFPSLLSILKLLEHLFDDGLFRSKSRSVSSLRFRFLHLGQNWRVEKIELTEESDLHCEYVCDRTGSRPQEWRRTVPPWIRDLIIIALACEVWASVSTAWRAGLASWSPDSVNISYLF